MLFRCGIVQCQIQRQHVDTGFAEQSDEAALGVRDDQLADVVFRHMARFRDKLVARLGSPALVG